MVISKLESIVLHPFCSNGWSLHKHHNFVRVMYCRWMPLHASFEYTFWHIFWGISNYCKMMHWILERLLICTFKLSSFGNDIRYAFNVFKWHTFTLHAKRYCLVGNFLITRQTERCKSQVNYKLLSPRTWQWMDANELVCS